MSSATTLAQLPLLWARHKQLEAYWGLAFARIAATPGASTAGMSSLRTLILRLGPDGSTGRGLMSGEVSPSKWLSLARLSWDGVTEQLKQAGKDAISVSRIWDEFVIPTAEDFAATARDVAQDVRDGFLPTLALVVTGLVAWAVLRVTR